MLALLGKLLYLELHPDTHPPRPADLA